MPHVATSHDTSTSGPSSDLTSIPRGQRREETARLLAEAHDTEDEDQRSLLHDRAIRLNMQVACEIARRYHNRGIATEDLEQVAYLGLTKAVRGFDPTVGTDFLSFAVPTIRGEVRRHFRDHGWTVRPPRWVQELQPQITATEAELFQQLGRSPRPSEIAEHLGEDLDRVVDALAANGCYSPASLDAPYGQDSEQSPVDRLVAPDDYAAAEARMALEPILAGLSPRERTILELRFGDGLTQSEIGERVGVTQMQISRVLNRLLKKLGEEFSDRASDDVA